MSITCGSVDHVAWWVGSGPEAEGGGQTGHRRGVSNARLVLHAEETEVTLEEFRGKIALFVVGRGPADHCHVLDVVDDDAVSVLFDQAIVAGLFDELGDPLERPLDRLVLPLVAVRRPVSESRDAVQVGDELQRIGSLGAEPPPR